MKRIIVHCLVPVAGLLASGTCLGADAPRDATKVTYRVVDLGSLGGTSSGGNSINNTRRVAGFSDLPDGTRHATAWVHGLPVDLGTLGGPNSNVAWPVKSHRVIAGIAETDEPDPLNEDWSCSAFFPAVTHQQCLGFAWRDGVMRPLPTLGGTHGFATGVDRRGRIVGWAENTVHDPTCNPPQVLQFRAVVWGPRHDQMRELPPLGDDTTSAATAINNAGQIVGISGICSNAVGEFSAAHAVLWEGDGIADLGDIGGDAWNTPMAINEHGVITGFANVTEGAAFNAHAFVWTEDSGMQDLETVGGDDVYSQGLGINAHGQIVGLSCTAGFASCRAFIWEDGVMTDLNTLLEPGYANHLYFANDINDFGEITGQSIDESTGEARTFVAIPSAGPGADDADAAGRSAQGQDRWKPAVMLPEDARRALLQRLGLGRTDL
jgi:probable HAF family extracellular repeat protein